MKSEFQLERERLKMEKDIDEVAGQISSFCRNRFDDSAKTAACRVGVGKFTRVAKQELKPR